MSSTMIEMRCGSCHGLLELTPETLEHGSQDCTYCGENNAIPADLVQSVSSKASRPPDTKFEINQSDGTLHVTKPPNGWTPFAKAGVVFSLVLWACAAGAGYGAIYVTWVFAPCAIMCALAAYVTTRVAVKAAYSWSELVLTPTTLLLDGYIPIGGWRSPVFRHRQIGPMQHSHITVRILHGSEDERSLIIEQLGKVSVFTSVPTFATVEELDWLNAEIQSFITQEHDDNTDVLATPHSVTDPAESSGSEAHSGQVIALGCITCGNEFKPTATGLMSRVLRCEHCGSNIVMSEQLQAEWLGLEQAHAHAGSHLTSPIQCRLGEHAMRIAIPRRSWNEPIKAALVVYAAVATMSLFGGAGLLLGDVNTIGGILMLLPGLALLIPMAGVVRSLYTRTEIEFDPQSVVIQRRTPLGTRTVRYPRERFVGAIVQPPAGITMLHMQFGLRFRRNDAEDMQGASFVDREVREQIGHPEYGDEWRWLAKEINAFQAGVDALDASAGAARA